MKNTQLTFIKTLLLFMSISCAANAQDFAKVDNMVKAYPKSFATTDKLAEKINADFKRDDEKARAIFTWLATNIKYDLPAINSNARPVAFSFTSQEEKMAKQKKFKNDLANKTLKTKKGVCQGYATLFEVLADKTGLESVMIPGSSKSHPTHIGKMPDTSDHAWNAVKIDGEWKLVDATWGAGTVTGERPQFVFRFNDAYFFTDPEQFFLNHYPDDAKWLLTKRSPGEFANLPLYYGSYLQDGYEFESPSGGTFINQRSGVIPFKIKNLKPTDKVAYAFSQEKMVKEVNPLRNGETAEFDVALDSKSTGYLTIYINQRSVASYRITRA